MRVLALVIAVTTLLSSSLAQFNDVEPDYGDYGSAPAPPPPRASITPRSYSLSRGQQIQATASRPTPVPILKQINRHNEDGSYTYGYEGADGSFKIETKLNSGEVVGKYGYVDDLGKVRVVEYGANKFGFQPSGEGITVAPPTLVDETLKQKGKGRQETPVYYEPESDDGQYYEEPAPRPAPRPALAPIRHAPPPPAPRPHSPAPTYETYERTIEFGPSPSSRGPSQGPTPPRAQVPGAVPSPSGFSAPAPPPSRPSSSFFQPSAPAPRPAPVARPAPQPAPLRPAPSGRSGGLLDQLAKDYALPSNAAPALSDISFGYY